ncbi:hypothetical protein [Caudoviricetes sp.]|nr:hypothetical protein [Caudoviricetes sp.]UOF82762.1 hypothetical protein [Caudoviricetes sp.]
MHGQGCERRVAPLPDAANSQVSRPQDEIPGCCVKLLLPAREAKRRNSQFLVASLSEWYRLH